MAAPAVRSHSLETEPLFVVERDDETITLCLVGDPDTDDGVNNLDQDERQDFRVHQGRDDAQYLEPKVAPDVHVIDRSAERA